MAVNNGGQIKTTSKGSQERAAEPGPGASAVVRGSFPRTYERKGGTNRWRPVVRSPDESPLVQRVYGTSSSSSSSSGNSEKFLLSEQERAMLLHTRYHAVPKLDSIAPLAAKW